MTDTKQTEMAYDADARTAVITFPNGRELKISNVSKEKAEEFLKRHAGEFGRRDCVLHSVGGTLTREGEAND